jgi:hypothetical protein
LNEFTVLQPRRALLILGIAVVATLLFAVAPGTARAECVSSTPSVLGPNSDPAGDNFVTAPDLRELRVSLDANCELLVNSAQSILPLQPNQYLIVQFDFDPPPPDPIDEIVDAEVFFYDDFTAYLNDLVPLPAFEPTRFTVTLDELGITSSPTQLGVSVVSVYDPTFSDPTSGDEVYDFHPEVDPVLQPMLRMPISFTTPAPPTPPAPPAPPAVAPAAPAATKKATGCVVPKLKGLTVKKAKAALKKAGCKYKLKGKGRVRSFSPKAGTTTEATVQVKCKKKKRKKRSRRSALRVAQYR